MFCAAAADYFRCHAVTQPAQGRLCNVMSVRPVRCTNVHAELLNAVDYKLTEC